MHPGDSLTFRRRVVYILILGSLVALGPFTVDLYLPAFPVLQKEFAVTPTVIQLTLTATAIGFAVGQLLVGPWSDRVGRRVPLIAATSVHILSSLAIVLAPNIIVLGGFRITQGMGAAASMVVAMAVARDLFGGLPLVKMLSRLALISGLAPAVAPVIGSQLLRFTDWRGVFVFLLGYGLAVLLAAAFFIIETLPPDRRVDPGHTTARERYRAVFTDRIFVGVAIVGAMTISGMFSYISTSAILFQEHYGLNAQQYGIVFGVNALGIIVGNQTSARLARRIKSSWIIAGSTTSMFLSALTIVFVASLEGPLVGILIPLFFFIVSAGFTVPQVQVLALVRHPKEAATAASVLGAGNFGLAGIISPIAGAFGLHDAVPLGLVMVCVTAVAACSLWFVVKPWTVPALSR